MATSKALITGITGQDGSFLAEHLLDLGYEVYGWHRPRKTASGYDPFWRLESILNRVVLLNVDLTDPSQVESGIQSIQPDECYHLGAKSFAGGGSQDEDHVLKVNVDGTRYLLSQLAKHAPECRVFFAGTSEMFGRVSASPQDETTPWNPRSIYGVSKLMAHEWIRYYRTCHNMFACTGILYNHESSRRGSQFVTRKITSTAARIKLGMERELRLGNLEAERDWGFAGDYVIGMRASLQISNPEDYVFATGISHTVREFLDSTFKALDLDYRDYVVVDPEFFREKEKVPLIGNIEKARHDLGWEPRLSFDELIRRMVDSDLDYYRNLL